MENVQKDDLTGKIFGKLKVISIFNSIKNKNNTYWACKCECGKEINIKEKYLLEHNQKCCGCSNILKSKFKKSLIGMKFGKLTVIEECDNKKTKSGERIVIWQTKCDCGNLFLTNKAYLLYCKNQSCGCNPKFIKINIEDKFHKLTVIKDAGHGNFECLCDCGELITVSSNRLRKNRIKSCDRQGCNHKYDYSTTSARKLWQRYLKGDRRKNTISNITFEQFLNLTSQDCFYCGAKPSGKCNCYSFKKNAREQAKLEGDYFYNGLDRLDCTKNHLFENVVPCCHTCNRAKSDKTLSEFYTWINNLNKNYDFKKYKLIDLPKTKIISSINTAYQYYKKDGNFSLQEFYTLSQQPCFYCGDLMKNSSFSLNRNKSLTDEQKKEFTFYYNGLDRIDSSKDHTFSNCVPCCKYCNFAKSNLSLEEFYEWIDRVQKFQKDKV